MDEILIRTALAQRFTVHSVRGLGEFLRVAKSHPPQLVLLDVSLGGENGFTIFEQLRKEPEFAKTPVFFVTANRDRESRLAGLGLGADDYITKPFDVDELLIRVSNRLARENLQPASLTRLVSGRIQVDLAEAKASILTGTDSAETADLTPNEYRLLVFLLRNPNRDLARSEIVRGVWGDEIHLTERTVDTHIKHLRRKLRDEGRRIESVHGVGFRLVSP